MFINRFSHYILPFLLGLSNGAWGDIIVSNLSNSSPTGTGFSSTGNPVWLANGFVTGTDAYTLDSITVYQISTSSTLSDSNYYRATLYTSSTSGPPLDRVAILDLDSFTDDPNFSLDGFGYFTHVNNGPTFILQPNTRYFVVFEQLSLVSPGGNFEQIRLTDDFAPNNIDNGYWFVYFASPAGWVESTDFVLMFEVNGTVIPEPSILSFLLLAGLASAKYLRDRSSRR
jgi:hypothetical protein